MKLISCEACKCTLKGDVALQLSVGELPGVAVFFLRGGRLDLAEGLRTIWTTRVAAPKN